MAIDDCKRTVLPDGSAVSKVSGAINPLTLVWIQEKMAEANANGIMVIPMMHYGILEHYTGQKNLEPLIKNAAESIPVLMNAGIRLVLTGHYHANSISSFTENGKTLTDIQTGSLVTPPYPYRMMTLDDNFINIDTRFVTSIDGEVPGGMDFLTYSETTIAVYMIGFFNYYLPKLFGLSPEDATLLAPSFAHAWLAYFAGDEKMSPAERNTINTLVQSKSPSLVTLLNNVWTDLAPKDTNTHIKLK